MQSDREKLIALMVEAESLCAAIDCYDGAVCEYAGEINGCAAFRADHLLANGVVVREWIPVTERLPERHGCYIVTACDEGCPYGEGIWYDTVVVTAEYYDGCWLWYEGQTEYDLCDIVTHWMPLPEPQKEEV